MRAESGDLLSFYNLTDKLNIKEWKNYTCWLVLVVCNGQILSHTRISTNFNGYNTSKYALNFKFNIITH